MKMNHMIITCEYVKLLTMLCDWLWLAVLPPWQGSTMPLVPAIPVPARTKVVVTAGSLEVELSIHGLKRFQPWQRWKRKSSIWEHLRSDVRYQSRWKCRRRRQHIERGHEGGHMGRLSRHRYKMSATSWLLQAASTHVAMLLCMSHDKMMWSARFPKLSDQWLRQVLEDLGIL